jgi:hypothetical protein
MLFILTTFSINVFAISEENSEIEADLRYEVGNNQHIFGICYIENIVKGDYEPTSKSPFMGFILLISSGINSETKIYDKKGGELIAHFEGPNTIYAFFMIGYGQCTSTSCIMEGNSFGVLVIGR